MMTKLLALLQGKLEEKRAQNKVKRVESALEIASLNFKTKKDDNEYKLNELLEKFKDNDANVEDVISEISDAMAAMEDAEKGMKRVEKIKAFLFEEVKA